MCTVDLLQFMAYAKAKKTDEIGAAISFAMLDGYRLSDLAKRLQGDAAISNLEITDDHISYDFAGDSIKRPVKRCHCGEPFAYDHDRYGRINPKTLHQPTIKGARQCNVCKQIKAKEASRKSSWLHRRKTGQVKAGVAECQHCGKLFDQIRSTAKFCSSKCRVAAHRLAAKA